MLQLVCMAWLILVKIKMAFWVVRVFSRLEILVSGLVVLDMNLDWMALMVLAVEDC